MAILRVLQAFAVLLFVDICMYIGTRRLYAVLRLLSKVPIPWQARSLDASVAAVNEASVWYFHRVQCLQRAAAVWLMARMRGVAVDLVIGYRPIPFQSHAWIEWDRKVVNDRPQYQRFFKVLDRV